MAKFNPTLIDEKAKILASVANTLKQEFFGLDLIIDRVISSINAWYTFPDLITRPVIINLWGLTGVGKTHLVRRLVELIEYRDRFVEVQMDGIASSSSHQHTTIAALLQGSSIEQGSPGVILLDEFQRFRTVSQDDDDVKIERFQDVWMLLSDGKFAADASMFKEIEMMIAYSEFEKASEEASNSNKKSTKKKREEKFHIWPYEARNIKQTLNLTLTIQEIMTWDVNKLSCEVEKAMGESVGAQLDYTKTLIFISGNLDEAFSSAGDVDNCDTDADVFHERSKQINVMDIKHALSRRFKPEQISRFGNNHIIYPSISKLAYQQIIHSTCERYLSKINEVTGIEFALTPESEDVIYANSVYPTQGTRPVFSSIHTIFSDGLVQIAFWAIKNDITELTMSINAAKSALIGTSGELEINVPIILDIDNQRKKAPYDFLLTVAVHEAGHALVHGVLKHEAPLEVKINTSSYRGGYMLPQHDTHFVRSKQCILDDIAVCYGGRAAELMVFGSDLITDGAGQDIANATSAASAYVRILAMDALPGGEYEPSGGNPPGGILPSITSSDSIVTILTMEQDRACDILTKHKELFIRIVEALLVRTTLKQSEFIELLPELNLKDNATTRDAHWNTFKAPVFH